jgi:hypothetical protein
MVAVLNISLMLRVRCCYVMKVSEDDVIDKRVTTAGVRELYNFMGPFRAPCTRYLDQMAATLTSDGVTSRWLSPLWLKVPTADKNDAASAGSTGSSVSKVREDEVPYIS